MSQSNVTPIYEPRSQEFLDVLHPSGDCTFQTFPDKGQKAKNLTRIFNGTFEKHKSELVRLNGNGSGIYVTVNQTDGEGRKLENITKVTAIFQEDDGGFAGEFPIPPTMMVESSPGKFHRYWVLKEPDPDAVVQFPDVMRRMVDDYGSDPAAMDICRVLRIPGFRNCKTKYEKKHRVDLVECEPSRLYTWEEIIEAFPPVEAAPANWREYDPVFENLVDEEQLKDIESALDYINGDEYGDWIAITYALKSLGKAGHPLWTEWSEKHKNFDPEENDRVWEGAEPSRTGFRAIFAKAQRNGWKNPLKIPKTNASLASNYAFIRSSGKFFCFRTKEAMSTSSFNQIEYGDKVEGNRLTAATTFKKRKGQIISGVTIMPCPADGEPDNVVTLDDGKRYANVYRARPRIKANSGEESVDLWLDLMRRVVPDEKERDWFIKHMAATVQHPERKINWQIINGGVEGCGKDSILRPMIVYFGFYASEIDNEMAKAGWGDLLAGKKVLVYAEVYQPGNKGFANSLKRQAALTGTGVVSVNLKGGAILEQPNLYSVYAMSNHRDCMVLSATDRRWFVIDSFDILPMEEEAAVTYHKWIDDGGWKDVIAYLLSINLLDFPWSKLPYQTEAHSRLVRDSQDNVAIVVRELIEEYRGLFATDLVAPAKVHKWFVDTGILKTSLKKLRLEMIGTLGCKELGKGQKKIDGKVSVTPQLFSVRNHELYMDLSSRERYELYHTQKERAAKEAGVGEEPDWDNAE